MKRVLLVVSVLSCALLVRAEIPALNIPDGGIDCIATDALAKAAFRGKDLAKGAWAAVTNGPAEKAWIVDVSGSAERTWAVTLGVPVISTIRSGEIGLLAFYARGVLASGAVGEAGADVVIENKIPPTYQKLGVGSFKVGADWTPVYIPFQAGVEGTTNLTHLSWQLAKAAQRIEIADARLLNYGTNRTLASMPRPYVNYPGRAADAPWRKAALERIESNRVHGFSVEVVDADGKPVAGAKVRAELKRHAFKFGSAIKAQFLVGTDYRRPGYQKAVEENFDAIVFENDLKPDPWDAGASGTHKNYKHDWVLAGLDWCDARDITTRGHYLMIGVQEPWSEALKDKPEELRERILGHMRSVTGKLGTRISEWDVLNHPAGWTIPRKTVDAFFDDGFYAEMYKAARPLVKTPLFVNEDQVFRPGKQQEYYYEIITNMIARGAKPDGIGNQAHFHPSFLPAPEEMLRVSDRFAALVPNLAITEFDMLSNGDEELQADWLRDCLITCYSHPAYTSFMLWVFWEGTGYKPECSLWHRDWTPKPNGQVWRDLVWNQWKTDVSGITATDGRFTARGHDGLYAVTVEQNGRSATAKTSFSASNGVVRVVVR